MSAALPAPLSSLPTPLFINDQDGLNPSLIMADIIALWESVTGKKLQPAQVERLFINMFAYRESLVRNLIQYCGEQCMLAFAQGSNLDQLGALLGVTRLAAVGATATIQFTLAQALSVQYMIPAGTQVGTGDGQFVFATNTAIVIEAGATTGSAVATCTTPGAGGDGYLAGEIGVMLNPDANIGAVANTDTSTGGSAPESDDAFRARIQLAPNQFSTAGPVGAYRFWTLSVDPAIIDAQIVSSAPGIVDVYVLTGPILVQPAASPNNVGIAGSTLLAEVLAALNDSKIRPLTDTVTVHAVTEVDYAIAGTVTTYADADPVATMAAVNAAVARFAVNQASRIGRDIVISQLVAAIQEIPGVYEVVLTSPVDGSGALVLSGAPGNWGNCTAINLIQVTASESS